MSWLIFSWVIFFWVIGSVSLYDLLDDPGRLHFDSVNDVLVHGVRQFSVDVRFREPAPLPCKFPSESVHLFPESTFVARPCLCRVVVGRLSCRGACVGPPTAFPVRALVYRGCPCRDPPVCHRVQGDSGAKRQPTLCVLVGVVTSCVPCARVRGHVPRSCATENTYTPARLEALFKLSVVTILSHSYRLLQHFGGLWVLCPTRHLV